MGVLVNQAALIKAGALINQTLYGSSYNCTVYQQLS